jgi:hypothetical protein
MLFWIILASLSAGASSEADAVDRTPADARAAAPKRIRLGLEKGELCSTHTHWQAKGLRAEGGVAGGCPLEGACDDPVLRDSFIPDENTPIKTIRLHFNVFAKSNGTSPLSTPEEVAEQVATMNTLFAPYRIQFVYTADFINDSDFFNLSSFSGGEMKATYAKDPGFRCNVYVVNACCYGGLGTFPWDPDALTEKGGVIMDADWFGSSDLVLAHELGHNLGLWHTHHGVSEVDQCSACYETAASGGDDAAGDFCSDTPPTPKDNDCEPPTSSDNCSGVPWGQTQVENYMSYSAVDDPYRCWSLFTSQQAGRMHCWIDAVLQTWLVGASDLNLDNAVNGADLGTLLGAWGDCPAPPSQDGGFECAGDLNGDGVVDSVDLGTLLADWTG